MKAVIVGGVAGGAGTAARLRRNNENAEIIILEKGPYISFANCGLPYYIGGVIAKQEALLLQTPAGFGKRFNVDVRVMHEVLAVNPLAKTVTVLDHANGKEYSESYDSLLLSPGAAPIKPAMPGMEKNHVFTLRNVPDTVAVHNFVAERRPASCVVAGAGFIGLEMAENLAKLGIQVSLVEAAPHAMAPLDLDMAHMVHNKIREKGIALHLGRLCTGFTATAAILDNGQEIPAHMAILSIGVRPETAFLQGSGLELGPRGEIMVNERFETSLPHIYAVGDAIAVRNIISNKQHMIPLASPANRQARLVADIICGKPASYKGAQGTAIMKFYDLVAACTGEKEENLKAAGVPYAKSITHSASNAGYYPGGEPMFVKIIFTPDTGRLLGAQIVGGKGVDKRIDHLAIAVRFGLTVFDLQEMELAYAPPFSSAKDPVNMAGYVGGNIVEGTMRPFFINDLSTLPPNAQLLDIRTAAEFAKGTIPGFVNIPLDELRDRMMELDKSKPIYITCMVGHRGYLAQRILDQHGFDTWNLAGGWRHYAAMKADA